MSKVLKIEIVVTDEEKAIEWHKSEKLIDAIADLIYEKNDFGQEGMIATGCKLIDED